MTDVISADPVVHLTPAAIKQVKYLMAKKGETDLALRVGVKGGGCSGYSYTMSLVREANANDIVCEFEDVKVYVDPKSARLIAGTTLDYSLKHLLEGGFVFENPNASKTCGCGTSFQPKS